MDATAIHLAADHVSLETGDATRVVATVVDSSGAPVENYSGEVLFSLQGDGELLGENPSRIRAGKAMVLFRCRGLSGTSSISATGSALSDSSINVKTINTSGK